MATALTLRQNKGSPLTFKEGDDNFLYLDSKIDAVSATTKIYDTKEAGLAATKDSETFWVIGSGDVATKLYRRVNSTTATELASALSTQFKADLADPAKGAAMVGFKHDGVGATDVQTALSSLMFNSVSEMKSTTNLKVGMKVRTLGYYSAGDGGGNDYEIVAAGTGVDDGGSFIDLSGSGLQARGLFGSFAHAAQFGAIPSPTDSSARLNRFHDFLREAKTKGFYAAGEYTVLQSVDVSGVDIEGVLKGYLNGEGTRLLCQGNDAFVQESTSSNNITYSIKKFRISGAGTALNMKYGVYCNVEDFYVRDSVFGIINGGVSGAAGPLWNTFRRGDIRVSDTAMIIQGGSWANANLVEAMYLSGDSRSAYINAGGLGAISNQFVDVEFAGPAFGVELGRNKSTSFNNCYFESSGPSIHVEGSTSGLSVTECTFGALREDNITGVLSHFYHSSSLCRANISGGFVYYEPGTTLLSFVRTENPAQFALDMTTFPSREGAPGEWFYDKQSVTRLSKLRWQDSYDIDWRGGVENPSIGNGTIESTYYLEGNICTVNIEINAGSTTDFGAGQWTMRVPFPSSALSVRNCGISRITRGNGENYIGSFVVGSGTTNGALYFHGTSLTARSNIPFEFATGDRISITITYPISERG